MLSFLTSVIGFAIIFRQSRIVCTEFALSYAISFFVHTVLSFILLVLYAYSFDEPIKLWLFIGIFFGTLKLFTFFLRRFSEKSFEERVPMMLDSVLVGMSSGRSFRSSCASALDSDSGWRTREWKEIIRVMEIENGIDQLKTRSSRGLYQELLPIFHATNKQKEQLLALRKRYSTCLNFRRRSGQLTANMRWQSGIMAIMFALLLIYVVTNFGYSNNQGIILLAVFLFCMGIVSNFFMGKGIKWKV